MNVIRKESSMKAILEFNLPEDRPEFLVCLHGGELLCFVTELQEHVRSILKHGNPPAERRLAYEDIRDWMWENMPTLPDGV